MKEMLVGNLRLFAMGVRKNRILGSAGKFVVDKSKNRLWVFALWF